MPSGTANPSFKHGKVQSGAYSSWAAMKQRCLNPNHDAYPHYGGRGITICERWLTFANFYADMGDRPEGMTLERNSGDGDYEPSNCRWATWTEQALNRPQTGLEAGRRARWPNDLAAKAKAELLADPDRSNAAIAEIVGCTTAWVRQVRVKMGLPPAVPWRFRKQARVILPPRP